MQNTKKRQGFSLIELLVGLVIISVALAAFAPIVNKKLRVQSMALDSKLTEKCSKWPDCKLCQGTKYCVQCNLECDVDHILNITNCTCIEQEENL